MDENRKESPKMVYASVARVRLISGLSWGFLIGVTIGIGGAALWIRLVA